MKHYYNKLCMVLMMMFALGMVSTQTKAQLQIDEGFNTMVPLPTGWAQQNLSTPAGSNPIWFQGNTTVFPAFSGPATSYAACNFNSVAGANTISNWLFTPTVTLTNGNIISFYTRASTGGGIFPDRLELRMSTNGSSVNVGASNTSVGDFTTLLQSVNPTLSTTGYPEVWTKYTVTLSGLAAPVTGRFAFRYYVDDGGPSGSNSNFIGVDEVQYGTPCSGTPNPGNTISSVASICPTIPFNLSLQNPASGLGITYQWQSAPAATGPWTNITGANNSTLTTSQLATTFYRAIVSCGANSANSTPVGVTLLQCYCPGTATSTAFEKISNVKLSNINNSSTSTAGYEDFTSITGDVFSGATMPITVTLSGGFSSDQVFVWIDLNRDYDFDDAGELLYTSANGVGPHTGNISIPASTTPGLTRMRIRMHDASLGPNNTPCGASAYGQVEDYTVNIQPCVPVTVTTQPANQTANCGNNATFTVALAGSLPSGYWQYRTSASGVWLTVPNAAPYSGVNTTALTITMAPYTLNGYQYRFLYQGACAGVNPSNAATFTVNPLVGTVVKSPAGSICEGSIQQLSITNTQPATTLTFNSAANLNLTIPDDGSTTGVNNTIAVSGIPAGVLITDIKVKMNITHAWAGDLIVVAKAPNNKVLNLSYALNATGGAGATTGFQPTYAKSVPATGPLAASGTNPFSGTYRADGYNPATGDPTVPTGPNGYLPTSAATTRNTFDDLYPPADNSSTLNGNWTLAMYDYYDDGTTANKFNNWSIEITYTGGLASGVWTGPAGTMFTDAAATVAYTGTAANSIYVKPTTTGVTNYSVVVSNGVCTSAPLTVPVAVNKLAASASAVAAKTICDGGSTYFKSTVDLSNNAYGNTYQWQVSTDNGATYTDVANGGIYSGANTDSLVITGAAVAQNGYMYRLNVTAEPCAGEVNSTAGTLTVNPLPILTVSANPYTAIYPGQTTTLAVASSTTVSAGGYQWYRNGVAIPGATANTLVVDVDGLGTYTVTANDVNACGSANTPSITITEAANDILFIYPSPNSGQFQVRYYSQAGNTVLPRSLNIYDNKGARVYSKQYAVTVPYTRMDVDLSNLSAGLYQVELLDRNGARIKTGKVLIQK